MGATEYGTPEIADLLKCLTALKKLGGTGGTRTRERTLENE
jgi:hypothetical protein